MQCVIYISNKSQYLKNEERYGKSIDGVPLSFQEFFQIRQILFDIFVDKRLKIRFRLLKLNIAPFYNPKIFVKHDVRK